MTVFKNNKIYLTNCAWETKKGKVVDNCSVSRLIDIPDRFDKCDDIVIDNGI